MTPDEHAMKRLREALADAGLPAPEDASLLELSVRASRLIREHADYLRSSSTRHTRILLSSERDDPWRVGAHLHVYDQDRQTWSPQLWRISVRDKQEDGTEFLEAGYRHKLIRKPGAAYAQFGKDRRFAVPEGSDLDAAAAVFPAPVFRGKEQVYSFGVEGLKFNDQGDAYLLARSWQEVVHVAARQGVYGMSAHHLSEYGHRGVGGHGETAARANPGVIMVEAHEITGTRYTYIPLKEWQGHVEKAREKKWGRLTGGTA